ncbi:MAG TPA: monooxygenase, partial [Micromonosporaceae bacterium]
AADVEPPAAPLRAGERFLRLSMPRPYTPAPTNGGTDEYRCFLVDPGLDAPAFVTGSQFLPQNAAIVHHAIFFRVPPEDVAQARELDAAAPGDGWTCFGGTGLGRGAGAQLSAGAAWIAAWAPGGTENVLRAGTGYRLAAGSQLIMQIHYSLLATGGQPAGPDQSSIRLRMSPGSAKLAALQTTLLPAPVELPCAAGESGPLCDREQAILDVWKRFGARAGATVAGLNLLCGDGGAPVPGPTQHCDHRVRQAGLIYAVAGHMHLLGRSIKVELNPGTARARTLLDVPAYNFDDQGAQPMAEPVQVRAGDSYRVTCTHDATLRQKLPELRQTQPRYVVWGDGTSDEMCLGIVIFAATGG